MESLELSRFDYVMLALKHAGRSSAEMPMIMTVEVGLRFGDELDYAAGPVNTHDCNGIINRIIELWTSCQMLPVETVRLQAGYYVH